MAIVLTELQHKQIEEGSESKLQAFQRKIYLKAKQNPKYKFYCLYDKIFRRDVLEEAYRLARANKGIGGIDGVEFEDLEGMAKEFIDEIQTELKRRTYRPNKLKEVQIPKTTGKMRTLRIPTIKDRVVQTAMKLIIEPIFEADFEETSYGYRRRKSAHQAIGAIGGELFRDVYRTKEARKEIKTIDLLDCFNTIPHKELMKEIVKRIIDREVLKLIKMILEVGREKGGDNVGKDKRGTPQGGVISPLFANIYLDKMDKYWQEKGKLSKTVRFADDMIILLDKREEEAYKKFLKYIEGDLKLIVNREKTVRNNVEDGVDYLGFTFRAKTSRKRKKYLSIEPSKKSMKKVKERIKEIVKWKRRISTESIIREVNLILRGWQQYFDNIGMGKVRNQINTYVERRTAKLISRRNKRSQILWKLFRKNELYDKYGLYKMVNINRKFA